ncbi:hypothetical protein [Bosea massiliensis]|uniref:Sulfur globule protein n=1 Tax=Bosea massiliensis TaxID=151419 RepID=A0ABW0P9D5_9HYPH|nr:MAG: hypothetical protein DI537_50640 [Stutzerimonas stutzeri]
MNKRTGMIMGLLMGLGAAMLPQAALAQHHGGGHGGGFHGGGHGGFGHGFRGGHGGFGHRAVWGGHGGFGGHHVRRHQGHGFYGAAPFIAAAAGLGAYGLYGSSYYPSAYGYGYGYTPAVYGYGYGRGYAPACALERQWVRTRHGLRRAWVETCY